MESSSTQGSIGSGGSQGGNLNSDFKFVKQLEAQHQSSIKNLTPTANKAAEMGATFDSSLGTDVGTNKVNTGAAAQFNFSVAAGKGGLVDEVF